MSTLSALAVLDSLIAEYEFEGEVVDARAAVAELIAALTHARATLATALPAPTSPKAGAPLAPDSNGHGQCLVCGETEWLAGTDCTPFPPLRDQRSSMPFSLTWLLEPLEKLQYLTRHIEPLDHKRWQSETTYLIDRIKDHEKGSQP